MEQTFLEGEMDISKTSTGPMIWNYTHEHVLIVEH